MKTVNSRYNGLEIAIVGMSGQFPGSRNCREYWQNLQAGKQVMTTFTDEELRRAGVEESLLKDPNFVKTVGVLDDKGSFDHGFFGFTSDEAALMDPQIRIFHQQCWAALDDAGYSSMIEKKKIALFAGASANDNWKVYVYSRSGTAAVDPFFLDLIKDRTSISTLVSYKLNLQGGSFFVDTGCSTSLVAVHLACRNLLTRESEMAIAGGICIRTRKEKGYLYREGMIASKDGLCRAFDAAASGTASGEGVGVVVLKRLSDALRDRDHIYCIIRSTSVNNDGNQKVGYTAPSVKGQAECIAMAQKMAGIDPHSVTYIETHGTGTRLGDPVEIKALNKAFDVGGDQKFCAIGSVKTNIGHLDTAAGIAGLIKTALCVQHAQLPPSLHFSAPNPEIDFAGGPFYVNTRLQQWDRTEGAPLRAGTSSLGIGGTNAHAILEEAPEKGKGSDGREYKLLTISARTEDAVLRYARDLRQQVIEEPEIDLADLAYTLQTGRKHFEYRASVVFRDRAELLDLLDEGRMEGQIRKLAHGSRPVVFLFPGQGAQYVNMGRALYDKEPVFREEMDKWFAAIRRYSGENFKSVLFAEGADPEMINETAYTQPLTFIVECSLAKLLLSFGIKPACMIGHSIGEYAAAFISGVFGFDDAIRLVMKRGRLMNSLPRGSMISIPLPAERVREFLGPGISLAAENAPEQCVLSGTRDSIAALVTRLNEQGIPHVMLRTSHAFHSDMMKPILEVFKDELTKLPLSKPGIPFVSNLTGSFIREEEARSPDYWVNHLLSTVKFSAGLQSILAQDDDCIFLEVGTGNSLGSLLRQQQTGKSDIIPVSMLPSSRDTEEGTKRLARCIGAMWTHGLPVDWSGYYGDESRWKISLPSYSFDPVVFPAEVDPFEALSGEAAEWMDLRSDGNGSHGLYFPSWKRAAPFSGISDPADRVYLFFSHPGEFSRLVKPELMKGNNEVVEIVAGDEFNKLSRTAYSLKPGSLKDINRLLTHLQQDQLRFTDIIYAWGMPVEGEHAVDQTFLSLAGTMKAICRSGDPDGMRIAIVTDRLHNVAGNERSSYAQSILLGLANSLQQEYPVVCINIDVNISGADGTFPALFAAELNNNSGKQDRIVAHRFGQRWIRDLQKQPDPLPGTRSTIRQGGTYLITGGLGDFGFVLAKHILTNYNAKVVLIGRRTPENDLLNKLNELKAIGREVEYRVADVSNLSELSGVTEMIEQRFGTIHGIIHAAGITANSHFELIEDITTDKTAAMFAPKVQGIRNLYEIFRSRDPDFVWITSSISTVLGGLGYSAYASANLFMDYFISARSEELTGWICMGLPGLDLKTTALTDLFERSISIKNIPVMLVSAGDLEKKITKGYKRKDPFPAGTAEGVERKKMARPNLSTKWADAGTATEKRVKIFFEEFFGLDDIGIDDNFYELGGDSLKGMMLSGKMRKEFDIPIALSDFLTGSTVRAIAAHIDKSILSRGHLIFNKDAAIQPVEKATCYPLSPSQLRLWIVSQLGDASVAYNMPSAYVFEGQVDPVLLEAAFNALIRRHESLRTVFRDDEQGDVKQFVNLPQHSGFRLSSIDIRLEGRRKQMAAEIARREISTSFDLADGPLLRATLIQLEDTTWVFVYVMHHIIGDGWSLNILVNELIILYNAFYNGLADPLIPLPVQYKDYVSWKQKQMDGDLLQTNRNYWVSQFREGIPTLDISGGRRPPVFSYRGNSVRCRLGQGETAAIEKLTVVHNSTLFTSLLFLVKLLLFRYTGNNRIIVGTSFAGRDHADLQNQIGLYLDNLPLITEIDGGLGLSECYLRVKETVLGALDHQDYPMDSLMEEIGYRSDASRPGLFNVLVELHTEYTGGPASGPIGFSIEPYSAEYATSNFDLSFDFMKSGEEIGLLITYNIDLFAQEEIELLKERFLRITYDVCGNWQDERLIEDIELTTSREKATLLESYLKYDMRDEKF